MNVGAICSREVITAHSADGLAVAARMMREKHVGCLVVVDTNAANGDLTVRGLLTDRDIVVTVIAKEADARALRVGDVMSRAPLLVRDSQPLAAAIRHMRDVGVRRAPVVGGRDELVGLLSLDDVLEALATQLTDVAAAVRTEQRVERSTRG